jgi:hypothetical protein
VETVSARGGVLSYNAIQQAIAAVMPIARATGLFVSRVTFQAPDGTLGAAGEPSGDYADVIGLIDIPCMNAPQPPSEIKLGSMEYRTPADVMAQADRHVLLSDYFPEVETNWRYGARAVIDGIQYNVAGAESDSQQTQTRVALNVITTGAVEAP